MLSTFKAFALAVKVYSFLIFLLILRRVNKAIVQPDLSLSRLVKIIVAPM
jgi:hypothetical protein